MYAVRQIIEDPNDVIPFPPELRHRRTEVIFIPLDQGLEIVETVPRQDSIAAFRGKGKGDAVTRLLADRQTDRERGE